MMCIPKSSCRLATPTVEALSGQPSSCALPFLTSREALVLNTVTWDGVRDGWPLTCDPEAWDTWLRASCRLEMKHDTQKQNEMFQGHIIERKEVVGDSWRHYERWTGSVKWEGCWTGIEQGECSDFTPRKARDFKTVFIISACTQLKIKLISLTII